MHSNNELLARQIQNEVNEYYHLYLISSDLIELRNLIATAQIIVFLRRAGSGGIPVVKI
jgi:hypothetical protein